MGDGAKLFNTEGIIQRRLTTASHEIENFGQYDYILVNDRLEESIDILQVDRGSGAAEALPRSSDTKRRTNVGSCRIAPKASGNAPQVRVDPGDIRSFPISHASRSEQ